MSYIVYIRYQRIYEIEAIHRIRYWFRFTTFTATALSIRLGGSSRPYYYSSSGVAADDFGVRPGVLYEYTYIYMIDKQSLASIRDRLL